MTSFWLLSRFKGARVDLCWRRGLALPERHHSQVAVDEGSFHDNVPDPKVTGHVVTRLVAGLPLSGKRACNCI